MKIMHPVSVHRPWSYPGQTHERHSAHERAQIIPLDCSAGSSYSSLQSIKVNLRRDECAADLLQPCHLEQRAQS